MGIVDGPPLRGGVDAAAGPAILMCSDSQGQPSLVAFRCLVEPAVSKQQLDRLGCYAKRHSDLRSRQSLPLQAERLGTPFHSLPLSVLGVAVLARMIIASDSRAFQDISDSGRGEFEIGSNLASREPIRGGVDDLAVSNGSFEFVTLDTKLSCPLLLVSVSSPLLIMFVLSSRQER